MLVVLLNRSCEMGSAWTRLKLPLTRVRRCGYGVDSRALVAEVQMPISHSEFSADQISLDSFGLFSDIFAPAPGN
jgi:hypothetical protein